MSLYVSVRVFSSWLNTFAVCLWMVLHEICQKLVSTFIRESTLLRGLSSKLPWKENVRACMWKKVYKGENYPLLFKCSLVAYSSHHAKYVKNVSSVTVKLSQLRYIFGVTELMHSHVFSSLEPMMMNYLSILTTNKHSWNILL